MTAGGGGGRTLDSRTLALSFLAMAALCAVSVVAVDRPLALWAAALPDTLQDRLEALSEIGWGVPWFAGSLAVAALGYLAGRRGLGRRALYLFATLALGNLVGHAVKLALGRARPGFLLDYGIYDFDPFHASPSWHSFPSGHTVNIVAVMAALAVIAPGLRWLLIPLGVAIGLLRVGAGMHFLSDVAGGVYVGILAALVAASAFERRGAPLALR